jgi:ribonuclease HI
MPKVSKLRYYAVRKGRKPGIYTNYKDCEEQVKKSPGALFKSFETRQQAEEYIHGPDIDENNKIEIWTDGYCKNNGKSGAIASIGVFFYDRDPRNKSERLPGKQTNNCAELYAVIRALEICDKSKDLIIYTDSIYVITCHNIEYPKKNIDLVMRMNDLIKERKGKVRIEHVKGHSGVYGNEQADRLAYLGSKKKYVEELKIPKSVKKRSIKDYFK